MLICGYFCLDMEDIYFKVVDFKFLFRSVGYGDGVDIVVDNNYICISYCFWFCDIFKINKQGLIWDEVYIEFLYWYKFGMQWVKRKRYYGLFGLFCGIIVFVDNLGYGKSRNSREEIEFGFVIVCKFYILYLGVGLYVGEGFCLSRGCLFDEYVCLF